jgi:hypothetical protein
VVEKVFNVVARYPNGAKGSGDDSLVRPASAKKIITSGVRQTQAHATLEIFFLYDTVYNHLRRAARYRCQGSVDSFQSLSTAATSSTEAPRQGRKIADSTTAQGQGTGNPSDRNHGNRK